MSKTASSENNSPAFRCKACNQQLSGSVRLANGQYEDLCAKCKSTIKDYNDYIEYNLPPDKEYPKWQYVSGPTSPRSCPYDND